MARKKVALINLLRMSRSWQDLVSKSVDEIDAAMRFVEFHEEIGAMSLQEAALWRCRIMACWAEQHRRPRDDRTSGEHLGGHLLQFAARS